VNKVYITAISKFLPNKPVSNLAIKKLAHKHFQLNQMELLAGGTSTPDLLIPSHVSMVQGELKANATEIISASGSCNAGMQALKFAFLSVKSGNTQNAISFGSEKVSSWIHARNYKKESEHWKNMEKKPILAFEKDFLRWMLSDGAGATLLQNKANPKGISLEINWMEIKSFSNELPTCMYAGGKKLSNEEMIPWRDFQTDELSKNSYLSLRQDVELLGDHIVNKGSDFMKDIIVKYKLDLDDISYFLPHLSSEYFREEIYKDFIKKGINIPPEKWFTNLTKVGNVGSASAYLMLEELFNEMPLKKGEKILLLVPESARFSYTFCLFTVV